MHSLVKKKNNFGKQFSSDICFEQNMIYNFETQKGVLDRKFRSPLWKNILSSEQEDQATLLLEIEKKRNHKMPGNGIFSTVILRISDKKK